MTSTLSAYFNNPNNPLNPIILFIRGARQVFTLNTLKAQGLGGYVGGKINTYAFPQAVSYYTQSHNLNFIMRMQAYEFQNYAVLRGTGWGAQLADIILPLPKRISTTNDISYSFEESDTSFNYTPSTVTSLKNIFPSLGIELLGLLDDIKVRRDINDVETVFKGPQLRSHTYSWDLVPKEAGDDEQIAKICKKFQVMAYPTLDTTLPSRRWKLPPVWTNFALNLQGGGNKMFRWDQGPMPAVLSNVSINPMGAGGPYAVVGDGSPAVTQLNLTFVEVDVAVSDENHDYLMPLSSALVRSSTNPIPKRLIRDDV